MIKLSNKQQGKRLREVREELNLTQEEFGKQIGKGRTTILKYEKGEEIPEGMIQVMQNVFNMNPHWLRTGEGDMFLRIVKYKSFEDRGDPGGEVFTKSPVSRLVPVNIWEWMGVGNPYDVFEQLPDTDHKPSEVINLPEELVNAWREGFQVKGESMRPTLNDGDYVGVDIHDKNFQSGELYAIYSKYEGYAVKRLESKSPYGILIKSDSSDHSDYMIDHDKIEHDLQIIGRVAWIFGTRKKHAIKR